jgi:aminoglycoside 3-N-acetyltransferase
MALSVQNDVEQALADDWRTAGIESGDIVLLHSRISRTLRRMTNMGAKPSPNAIIESFLKALGEDGTLLLPLFNFEFAEGKPFDIRSTKSQMGILTETGRIWPGATRSGHPIYSFAAIGRQAPAFDQLENFSAYGENSPFGMLRQMGGKIAVLDLPDQDSVTFYHHVEEALNVPYRYHKTFTGSYIDKAGTEANRTFSVFVRNLDAGVITKVDPMSERLWRQGIYNGYRPNEGPGLRTISAKHFFDEVAAVIQNGEAKGLLYDVE